MQVNRLDCNVAPDEPAIAEQETMAELERILSDPEFRSTERNWKFLRYVTERMLQGGGDKIKAYSSRWMSSAVQQILIPPSILSCELRRRGFARRWYSTMHSTDRTAAFESIFQGGDMCPPSAGSILEKAALKIPQPGRAETRQPRVWTVIPDRPG